MHPSNKTRLERLNRYSSLTLNEGTRILFGSFWLCVRVNEVDGHFKGIAIAKMVTKTWGRERGVATRTHQLHRLLQLLVAFDCTIHIQAKRLLTLSHYRTCPTPLVACHRWTHRRRGCVRGTLCTARRPLRVLTALLASLHTHSPHINTHSTIASRSAPFQDPNAWV